MGAAAVLLMLSSCSSFFGGAPASLYRVTPVRSFPQSLPHLKARLVVDVPTASPGLDTARIALTRPPVSIDYFADSAWVERAPRLIAATLLQSFENSDRITVFDGSSLEASGGLVLKSEIRDFEAVYRIPAGPPRARVAIRVRLFDAADRRILAEAEFASAVRAGHNDVPSIILAFNQALDEVLGKIVIWTLTNPALSATRG